MGSYRWAELPSTSHSLTVSEQRSLVDVTMQWLRFGLLTVLLWLDRGQSSPMLELGEEASQISILPYTFDLHPDTHKLHTTWEVAGASVSSICAFGTVSMVEVGWTGKDEELSSGNSWAVNCQQSYETHNQMEVEVDVTKFKVQPFRSYKVCISVDDYEMNWSVEPVCTHLFSFEKYVPYIPDMDTDKSNIKDQADLKDETVIKDDIIEPASDKSEREDKTIEIESVLKHQLSNIEHFVRDDFKTQYTELKEKIVEEFDLEGKILHSGGERSVVSVTFTICILLARTFLLNFL